MFKTPREFLAADGHALAAELAALRAAVDALAGTFECEYGARDETVDRAEQLSAAIQRLEWAIARHPLRSIAKAAAA